MTITINISECAGIKGNTTAMSIAGAKADGVKADTTLYARELLIRLRELAERIIADEQYAI